MTYASRRLYVIVRSQFWVENEEMIWGGTWLGRCARKYGMV